MIKKHLAKFEAAIFLVPAIASLILLLVQPQPNTSFEKELSTLLAYNQPRSSGLPDGFDRTDYLDVVCANGTYRWAAARLPLRIFIADGSATPGFRASFCDHMARAFDAWCTASGGRLSWTRVASPRNADILCTWQASPEERGGGIEAGVTKTMIQQELRTGRTAIASATVNILTQLFGRPFTDTEIYKTCLHEAGHALGLQGHSNLSSDIMYPALNPTQVATLKQRDINTIVRLYSGYEGGDSEESTVAQAPGHSFADRDYYGGGSAYPNGYQQPDFQLPRGDFPSQYRRSSPGFAPAYPRPRQFYQQPGLSAMQQMALQLALQRMQQRGYGW